MENLVSGGEAFFSHYGKSFQEKIFQGLVTDKQWAAQMIEVMDPDYFDVKYLNFLTDKYFSYFHKYKCFPTNQLLVSIIRDDLKEGHDILLREQIVEFLTRIKSNPYPGDIKYVKDKALDFCKRQAFKVALEKAVEMVEGDKFESVVGLMKDAVAIGMPNTTGHDFFEDLEARFVHVERNVVPTGIEVLDTKDVLSGGLGKGEIGVIMANSGVGKSHWLVAMGAAAVKSGRNVLHYTFELSEHIVGTRYDSNFCNISSTDVKDKKEDVIKHYNDNPQYGKLIIKEYPTGGASIMTLRNHMEKLSLKSFKPHVIIVDYADIMRSSKSYDSLRHELKLIYEELRNLAMELGIPVWTASQANRSSATSEIVGLENVGESYGKIQVADVVLSLSRKAEEKATGAGRLFVAKNRAGKDGIIFPIHIDTARSKFTVLESTYLTPNEVISQADNEMKNVLKQKWKEVKKEF